MKALTWEGKHSISVKNVRDPKILRHDDVIIKITTAAICGSDLHLYNGYIPTIWANSNGDDGSSQGRVVFSDG
tara:strand:- start:73425 stop:73643 length:219 start_codon:yes stop_codon:yes gene_type:complete